MAKRQTPRRVIIRLTSRDPKDRLALLKAIEKAFRPGDFEISVTLANNQADGVPNEQLEAKATEQSSKVLDEKERNAQTAQHETNRTDSATEKRTQLRLWVEKNIPTGFRILVKVLPIAKQIKQLLE